MGKGLRNRSISYLAKNGFRVTPETIKAERDRRKKARKRYRKQRIQRRRAKRRERMKFE